jgi:mercuric ion transport protein
MNTNRHGSKNGFIAALVGTALVALCCFTPILIVLFSAVGLSAFTPYLDVVLLPVLGIMAVLIGISFVRWRKSVSGAEK